jgi:hypothetical protein
MKPGDFPIRTEQSRAAARLMLSRRHKDRCAES